MNTEIRSISRKRETWKNQSTCRKIWPSATQILQKLACDWSQAPTVTSQHQLTT